LTNNLSFAIVQQKKEGSVKPMAKRFEALWEDSPGVAFMMTVALVPPLMVGMLAGVLVDALYVLVREAACSKKNLQARGMLSLGMCESTKRGRVSTT
jgi:hypothetical protein